MAKPRPEKKPGPAPPTIRVAGRVGDLLLARVLGLGLAHFPFAPRGSTVSRRQRYYERRGARHEWAPKSPRYSTTAPTRIQRRPSQPMRAGRVQGAVRPFVRGHSSLPSPL